MSKTIAEIEVGLPVDGPFDYKIPPECQDGISLGSRVRINFAGRDLVGYVTGFKARSRIRKLKAIDSLLDPGPVLHRNGSEITRMMRDHYGCAWGEAIEAYLPARLRQVRPLKELPRRGEFASGPVTEGIIRLLHDPAGEASWTRITDDIRRVLADGRQVIVLCPLHSRLTAVRKRLAPFSEKVSVLDRSLTPAQEWKVWSQIRSGDIDIVMGVRTAVFAPLPRLGLIVILHEEHDAYKEDQSPHYHVHDVADFRRTTDGADVTFVSAVPSVSTWHRIKKAKAELVSYPWTPPSAARVIDMNNFLPKQRSFVSFPVRAELDKLMAQQGRALFYMNRKGRDVSTLNAARFEVNYVTGLPRLEQTLDRLYPHIPRVVVDKDYASGAIDKGRWVLATSAIFGRLNGRTFDLVTVPNLDPELGRMDFRASEKTFALLVHLRRAASKLLFVQTQMPDVYCIRYAAALDFKKFYAEELRYRKQLALPPFATMVAVEVRGSEENIVLNQSRALLEALETDVPDGLDVADTSPEVLPLIRGQYRHTIIVKGRSGKKVLTYVKRVMKSVRRKGKVIVTLNVNP